MNDLKVKVEIMKMITLCYSFLRKNKLSAFVTVATMTIALFILSTLYGNYKYQTYTRDVYATSELQPDLYFMMQQSGDPDSDILSSNSVIQGLKEFNGFKKIIQYRYIGTSYKSDAINVHLYDSDMRKNFKLQVNKGHWLSESPTHTEAVVGGVVWSDVKLHDIIRLGNGIEAEVVGIMGDVVFYPNFNRSSNDFIANYLFKSNDNVVFVSEETVDADIRLSFKKPTNFFVQFEKNATSGEKQDIYDYLMNSGMVRTYTEIIENTNKKIEEWIKGSFPLPIFLLAIATVDIVCICMVILARSMAENSIYYLLGSTIKKGVETIVLALSAVFSLPCILNILGVMLFPNFLRADRIAKIDYIFDLSAIYPIITYMVAVIILISFLSLNMYRKYSPMNIYRRNQGL